MPGTPDEARREREMDVRVDGDFFAQASVLASGLLGKKDSSKSRGLVMSELGRCLTSPRAKSGASNLIRGVRVRAKSHAVATCRMAKQ